MIKNNLNKIIIFSMIILTYAGAAWGQLDDRFGAKGVEGTQYLGQKGLNWYRDWEDSYLPEHFPPKGKSKIWTVGKIDYRSDNLGMDYKWIVLDLLEKNDDEFLQNLLNLSLTIVDSNIVPVIDEYWETNRPLLETMIEDTLDNFVYTEKMLGIKYRATAKNTEMNFQEELPEMTLKVVSDTISFKTNFSAVWKTHLYIDAWIFNPFKWKYSWEDIGDADAEFETTVHIYGKIILDGQGRGRFLQVESIVTDAITESDIDWSLFGISFTWESLSNEIEQLVDRELEDAMNEELNKEPITSPYYLVDFFKSLFSEEVVPTQQEILDRIFEGEKNQIQRVFRHEGSEKSYWSIGYEPNWLPLLSPEQYAAFYTKYYRLIKSYSSSAKILGPSLLLTSAIENPGEAAWQFIPELFRGVLGALEEDFKNLVMSYFEQTNCKTWYTEFLSLLPPDVNVDINDFHVFPMSPDNQTINWDSLTYKMDEMAMFMRNASGVEEVWISGFGNGDSRRTVEEVAEMCSNFCQYFKSNEVGIKRWFWYLSKGTGPFYDIPLTPKPPITALLNRNNDLTKIGEVYLREADNSAPVMASAPIDEGRSSMSGQIEFKWEPAIEYDTGISDYLLEVKAEPGDSVYFSDWVGNETSHIIRCSASGVKLYARVAAKNGAGLIGDWSPWSDGILIKLKTDALSTRTDEKNDQKTTDEKFLADNDLSDADLEAEENITELRQLPDSFALLQNYPNPFNSTTAIRYHLQEDAHVVMKIYNARGEEVKTLIDGFQSRSIHTIYWDGRDNFGTSVAAGVYVYQITAGSFVSSKKMVVLK